MATGKAAESPNPEARGTGARALAVGLGAAGLALAHWPMIGTGLRRVQTDPGDTRLINYFLEHAYLWARGAPGHRSFWNPPFFYPARNIAAYSDTMLGAAPPYALLRLAGAAPDTAFQLWMIVCSALNYAVMLKLLRSRLGFVLPAAAAGAFLFAFGAPRVNLLGHQQHLPAFLGMAALDALFALFSGVAFKPARRAGLWLVAAGGLMAQCTSGFYLAWFLLLGLGIAAAAALMSPAARPALLGTVRRDAAWIVLTACLTAVIMRPWLGHHLSAARELGPRYMGYVNLYLPCPTTWLYMGPDSWSGAWTSRLAAFPVARTENEQRIGVGPVTTLAALAGLWLGRRRAWVPIMAASMLGVAICVTAFPPALLFGVAEALTLGALAFALVDGGVRPLALPALTALAAASLRGGGAWNTAASGLGLATLLGASAVCAAPGETLPTRPRNLTWVLAGMIAVQVFPSATVLGYGLVFGLVLAALSAAVGWRSWRVLGPLTLAGLLAFAVPVTYWGRWDVLGIAAGVVPALLIARLIPPRVRPDARHLTVTAAAGLALVELFYDNGTAWPFFYYRVPGASSLLFVSRVGLTVLIGWAVGLALCLDILLSRRRLWLAAAVGAACLAEQAVATGSYDKRADRAVVAALARRVEQGEGARAGAFYYTPHAPAGGATVAHLDAMWAGLLLGKPTVNGYSGSTPVGWRDLEECIASEPCEVLCLGEALEAWRAASGRGVGPVHWVGGPPDPWRGNDSPSERNTSR